MILERIRVDCPECGGTGQVENYRTVGDTDAERVLYSEDDCPTCGGTGQIWSLPEDQEFDKYEDD